MTPLELANVVIVLCAGLAVPFLFLRALGIGQWRIFVYGIFLSVGMMICGGIYGDVPMHPLGPIPGWGLAAIVAVLVVLPGSLIGSVLAGLNRNRPVPPPTTASHNEPSKLRPRPRNGTSVRTPGGDP